MPPRGNLAAMTTRPPHPPTALVLAPAGPPAPAAMQPGSLPAPPEADRTFTPTQRAAVVGVVKAHHAPKTQEAYARGWRLFEAWCHVEGRSALPAAPETLMAYLATTTESVATLRHVLAAVTERHAFAGYDPPPTAARLVRAAWAGVRRTRGTRNKGKDAATIDELRPMLTRIDRTDLRGMRDAAVLLVGFAAALRRSEIAALDVEHVRPAPGGIALLIARSKTDQEGAGEVVGIAEKFGDPEAEDALCPVLALRAWTRAAKITAGPLFVGFTAQGIMRSERMPAQEVARVVKRYLPADASPELRRRFSGHSLRAGFITQAVRDGASDAEIMGTSRHESTAMLVRYRREADPVRRGASTRIKTRRKS